MERPLECSAEQPQKCGVEAHHRAQEVEQYLTNTNLSKNIRMEETVRLSYIKKIKFFILIFREERKSRLDRNNARMGQLGPKRKLRWRISEAAFDR